MVDQLGAHAYDAVVSQRKTTAPPIPLTPAEEAKILSVAAKIWGRRGGKKGGVERAKRLTQRQRSAISAKGGQATAETLTPNQRAANARKAALARWAKRKQAAAGAPPDSPPQTLTRPCRKR